MYRLVNLLIRPFTLAMLLLGLGLVCLWWRRRESRRMRIALTLPYALLLLTSTPAVSHLALRSLERRGPAAGRPPGAGMIVVLAGGAVYLDPSRTRAELADDSLYRCVRAAEVYREGPPCPVVASGGRPHGSTAPLVAPLMVEFLRSLGVRPSDLSAESGSATTHESAAAIRARLEGRGPTRVVLVTEAYHMDRSLRCFRAQGIDAVPAPCHPLAPEFRPTPAAFLPSADAIRGCQIAFHEWAGMLWYKLRGWI